MKKKDNGEPRDEFDHIAIPSFVTKPFEMLAGRAGPAPQQRPVDGEAAGQSDRDPVYGDSVYGDNAQDDSANRSSRWGDAPYGDSAYDDSEEARQPRPIKWWQGPRGKLVAYAAGTLILFFLQTRG